MLKHTELQEVTKPLKNKIRDSAASLLEWEMLKLQVALISATCFITEKD